MTTYEELLTEVQQKFDAFKVKTAKKYVPKLWETLKNENPNLSREDLRARLDKDCLEFWEERTILEALPDEAKDQKKQKFARSSQKKRISAAETAAPITLRREEIIINTDGKPIEKASASPMLPDGQEDQLDTKEDRFKSEFSIPIANIWEPVLDLKSCGEDKIWFEAEFDRRTANLVSINIAEKSRQFLNEREEQLQKYIHKTSKSDSP